MNTTTNPLTTSATPRRRISTFNLLYLAVFVGGGVWCLVEGVWFLGAVFLGLSLFLGLAIARSRRGAGSDTERLNAVQPYDEREQAASTWAFAIVGQAALLGLTALFVGQIASRDGEADAVVVLGLLGLAVVWGVANRLAVRRG